MLKLTSACTLNSTPVKEHRQQIQCNKWHTSTANFQLLAHAKKNRARSTKHASSFLLAAAPEHIGARRKPSSHAPTGSERWHLILVYGQFTGNPHNRPYQQWLRRARLASRGCRCSP